MQCITVAYQTCTYDCPVQSIRRSALDEIMKHQVGREIVLHSKMHHQNIIPIWSAWKDDNYIYMAMEWAEGVRDL